MLKMVNRKMRRVGLILFCAALLLAVSSSCFAAGEVLKVRDWVSPALGEATAKWLEWNKNIFEQENPGVKLEYEFVPFSAYQEKMLTSHITGDVPDAFHISWAWIWELIPKDVLLPLSDFVSKTAEVSGDQFLGIAGDYARDEKGTTFAIPCNLGGRGIIWNLDRVKEVGLDPNVFETIQVWDDFVSYAKKMTERDETGKIAAGYISDFPNLAGYALGGWLPTNGATFYNKDRTGCGFNDQQGREVLQFFVDLLHKDRVLSPVGKGLSALDLFLARKSFISDGGGWESGVISNKAPDLEFTVTPRPRGPSGTQRSGLAWINGVAISAKARNPELAWKYVKSVCGYESQVRKLNWMGWTSPRKDVYQSEATKEVMDKELWIKNWFELVKVSAPYPNTKIVELKEALEPLLFRIISTQELLVEEGLNAIEEAMEGVLAGW